MGKIFAGAVLAGIMIGIAGTVNLAMLVMGQPVIGAFMFGLGLLAIVCLDFKLYTGAIGYLIVKGRESVPYLRVLLAIWCGNLVGTGAIGMVLRYTRRQDIVAKGAELCDAKLADGMLSIFILSVLCGILMFLAVDGFKSNHPGSVRMTLLFLCVSVFILCGFEHCIANMYYFWVGGRTGGAALWYLLIMTLGNSVGGMLIPGINKLRGRKCEAA